ncbi:MAG TPA: O-antigen ligase family protein [Holophagaceae bacterium]
MNQLDEVFDHPGTPEGVFSGVVLPVSLGLGINLLSLAIGAPYPMAVVGLVAAVIASIAWSERPLAWTIFVSLLAANPANTTTPIALNLYAALLFFMLARGEAWREVPRLVQFALGFVLLSMMVSILVSLSAHRTVPSINSVDVDLPRTYSTTWTGGVSADIFPTQLIAILNYLLGPFLLIPLIFTRVRRDLDPDLLVKGLVFGLILPTILLFLIARGFGRPTIDPNVLSQDLLNVSTFRLGKIDIQMIRTQSGIILASLICGSFAIAISPIARWTRLAATGCLAASVYLMLITGSVGSSLASLAGMVLILLMGKRRFSIRRYFLLLLLGAGLAVSAWSVMPTAIQQYAVSRYEVRMGKSGSAVGDRAWRWKKAFNYLTDHPSGVGWSIYIEPLGTYPHNDYLTYAIAYGVLCGLVYLLYPAGLLFSFIFLNSKVADPSRFALALAGAGITTVLLINSMSDHMTANRWYFNVIWSLIWYAFAASRTPRTQPVP